MKFPDQAYWQQGHAFLVISPVSNWQNISDQAIKNWQVSKFDLTIVGQDQPISVESARELRSDCQKQPIGGPIRLGILWGIERISDEAANSLLKILEEPPTATRFLLFSKNRRVLPTIRSRCQVWTVPTEEHIKEQPLVPLDKRLGFAKVIVEIKKVVEENKSTELIDQWIDHLLDNQTDDQDKALHWLIEARTAIQETAVNQEALLESAWLNLTKNLSFIDFDQEKRHMEKRRN